MIEGELTMILGAEEMSEGGSARVYPCPLRSQFSNRFARKHDCSTSTCPADLNESSPSSAYLQSLAFIPPAGPEVSGKP